MFSGFKFKYHTAKCTSSAKWGKSVNSVLFVFFSAAEDILVVFEKGDLHPNLQVQSSAF